MNITKFTLLGILSIAIGATGCNKSESTSGNESKSTRTKRKLEHTDGDHEHGAGPHKGVVIDFGKYHVEFTVDHAKKAATIYILNEDLTKNEPITVEKFQVSIKNPQFQAELKPEPQEGDSKGKSSRFVATHDNFGKEQEFEGTISGEIEGKPYVKDFKEEEHTDHDHGKKK